MCLSYLNIMYIIKFTSVALIMNFALHFKANTNTDTLQKQFGYFYQSVDYLNRISNIILLLNLGVEE